MYRIEFTEGAKKEFEKLDGSVRLQVQKAIEKRAANPKIPASRLSGADGSFYKIKFRSIGIRVVYQVIDNEILILIVKIGRRDNDATYNFFSDR